jgi:hypothetical protein
MTRTSVLSAFAGVLGLIASASSIAADSTVLRVLVIQTQDVSAYVSEVKNLQALYSKNGLQITLRVWRATYAGPDTGTIVLSAELPNLAAVATISDSVKKNPEIAAEMKKINGMRKIVSDSLYDLQTN